LFSYTTNTVGLMAMISGSLIVPHLVNKMDQSELDTYPNYLLIYWMHHYLAPVNMVAIVGTYFAKSVELRKKIRAKLAAHLNVIVCCLIQTGATSPGDMS
jgi:small-conductance mechanosensitive channel